MERIKNKSNIAINIAILVCISLLILVLLLVISSKDVESLSCDYDSEPYITSKINWKCILNSTDYDYRCYSYTMSSDRSLISVYPYIEDIVRYGRVDYLIPKNRIVNVYFGDRDIYPYNVYLFGVVCASTTINSSSTEIFEASVTPQNRPIREPTYRVVWFKSQLPVVFGFIIFVVLILLVWGVTKKW